MKKKIIFLEMIIFILLIICSNNIYAMTSDEMIEEIYSMGYMYGMTNSDKVKMERFINQYGITEDQINKVMAKVNEALKILQSRNSVADLSTEDINCLKDIVIQTAEIVDATVVFTSDMTLDLYKNGVKFDSIRLSDYKKMDNSNSQKLVYTGSNSINDLIYCIGLFGVILIIFYYIKRKIVYES